MQPNTTAKPIGDSRYPIKVLLTITAVSLLVNYVETMVIPGVPTIQKDFAASETIASWVTSAFLIVGAAVAPLFGKLGDIYGKKKILLIVLTFYIVGVGLAGFSNSIYMLILSRAIQGIGFAIVPLGLALIADIFPREKVATAQGIISGTFAIGAAAGLVIGAYVVQDLRVAVGIPHGLHPEHNSIPVSYQDAQKRPTRRKKQSRLRRRNHTHVRHCAYLVVPH